MHAFQKSRRARESDCGLCFWVGGGWKTSPLSPHSPWLPITFGDINSSHCGQEVMMDVCIREVWVHHLDFGEVSWMRSTLRFIFLSHTLFSNQSASRSYVLCLLAISQLAFPAVVLPTSIHLVLCRQSNLLIWSYIISHCSSSLASHIMSFITWSHSAAHLIFFHPLPMPPTSSHTSLVFPVYATLSHAFVFL